MSTQRKFTINVSGDVREAEDVSLIRAVGERLLGKGVFPDSIDLPFKTLVLVDDVNVFVALSFTNIAADEDKLFFENLCNVLQLSESVVKERCISKYNFQLPYLFSFPKRLLLPVSQSHSVFSDRDIPVKPDTCFVIMPFSKELEETYREIGDVFRELGEIIWARADTSVKPEVITEHIWEQINASQFMIADLTGQNPGVYYELGLAHSLRKPVIMITQEASVPFDISNIRYIRYSLKDDTAKSDFRTNLMRAVVEVLKSLKDEQA